MYMYLCICLYVYVYIYIYIYIHTCTYTYIARPASGLRDDYYDYYPLLFHAISLTGKLIGPGSGRVYSGRCWQLWL